MDKDVGRRVKLFYGVLCDRSLVFSSGEILRVSMGTLAYESPVFERLYVDSSERRLIKILDFDFEKFKLFLDCLMDFQDPSFIDALELYPISRKYQCERFTRKCLNILEPKEMNNFVIVTLNLSLSWKCEELRKKVIGFLSRERLFYRIFHDGYFYYLLQPESVCELLKYVEFDSYILEILCEWGSNYLKKRNLREDLKTFFFNNGISDYFYMDSCDCFKYFKIPFPDSYYNKGKWFNLRANEMIIEKFAIKEIPLFPNYNLSVTIFQNPLIFYEYPKTGKMISYEYVFKILDMHDRTEKIAGTRTYSLGEEHVSRDMKMLWTIDNNICNRRSILEIEIKRIFHYECRILKSCPKNYIVLDPKPDNLYMTKRIQVYQVEK